MTTPTPTISLIIPTIGRRQDWLDLAVSRALEVEEIKEIVVVIDGPTDGCVFGHRIASERLRVVKLAQNGGVSSAINAGVHVSSGDFIIMHGDDDCLARDWISPFLELPELESTDVICSRVRRGHSVVDMAESANASRDDLLCFTLGVGQVGLIYRSSVLRRTPFDEDLRSWEDWDHLLRLKKSGCRFGISRSCTVEVRDHDGVRLTQNRGQLARDLAYLYDKHSIRLEAPKVRAIWEYKIGRNFALARDRRNALSWFKMGMMHDPLHPGRWWIMARSLMTSQYDMDG